MPQAIVLEAKLPSKYLISIDKGLSTYSVDFDGIAAMLFTNVLCQPLWRGSSPT
jgi:hypothetical protein